MTTGNQIWVHLGADAGWYFELSDLPDRESLDIEGADEAWIVCSSIRDTGEESCAVHVRLGPNALKVDGGPYVQPIGGSREDLVMIATRAVDLLV